jgi:predicted lipoprotein with Yx(FWY)xxD motif
MGSCKLGSDEQDFRLDHRRIKMRKSLICAALVSIVLSAASGAFAQATGPAKIADTSKGKTLVDAKGMTLYTFDKDSGGKSTCNGQCATSWPPLMAAASDKASGDWSVVTRDDKSSQWAYKGKPLYTFVKDTKPGDVTGDGVFNGAWHVAMP